MPGNQPLACITPPAIFPASPPSVALSGGGWWRRAHPVTQGRRPVVLPGPTQQLPLAIPLSTLETTESLGKHGLVNVSTPPPTPGTHNIFREAPRMAHLSFSAAADFAHGVVQGRPQSRARRPSHTAAEAKPAPSSPPTPPPHPLDRPSAHFSRLFRHTLLTHCPLCR